MVLRFYILSWRHELSMKGQDDGEQATSKSVHPRNNEEITN